MILITGMYNVKDGADGFIVENIPGVELGPAYTNGGKYLLSLVLVKLS